MKTYAKLSEELNIPRSTLQRWVQKILKIYKKEIREGIIDNSMNLFDDETVNKIWYIRFLKQLNYKNKEIENILNDPDFDSEDLLTKAISELTKQREELDRIINIAKIMKETGMNPIKFGLSLGMNEMYGEYNSFMKNINNMFNYSFMSKDNIVQDNKLIELLQKVYYEMLVILIKNAILKNEANCQENTDSIKKFHDYSKHLFGDSVMIFIVFIVMKLSSHDFIDSMGKKYNENIREYIYQVVSDYIETLEFTVLDKKIDGMIDSLEECCNKKYEYNNHVLQKTIKDFYDLGNEFKFLSNKGRINMFKSYFGIREDITKEEYLQMTDEEKYKYDIGIRFLKEMEKEENKNEQPE